MTSQAPITLESVQQEISDLQQSHQQFLHTLSHDLQAPVRSLIGFSQLLTSNDGSIDADTTLQYLSFINQSASQLQQMIDGLLSLARLGNDVPQHAEVNMNDLLNEAVGTLGEGALGAAALTVEDLPTITGDADQLVKLWQVLLHNALLYQPTNNIPAITINATEAEDSWQFSVQDNGIGIPEKSHERVFQIFQRLHQPDVYPGVGVGLTIAHKIVTLHHGTISLESTEHVGTTVRFSINKMV